MVKTTAMEKGRDTGSEMWNQVLLGNGRVEEQWWWRYPLHPRSLQVSLLPHILCHAALASSSSSPSLTISFLLPCPEGCNPCSFLLFP